MSEAMDERRRVKRRRDRQYSALLLVMGLAMAWVGQAWGGEPLVSRDAGFFGGDHDLVGEVERPAAGMLSVAQRLGVGILGTPTSVLELRATTDDYYTTLLTTGTEMVVNGGFETWPDGWVIGTGIEHLSGAVHSGSYATRVSAGYQIRSSGYMAFDGLKQYQLTFWTRGDGYFAGAYNTPGVGSFLTGVTGTTYQKVTRVFGPGIWFGFVSFWGVSGQCYFDDVSIKSISTLVFHPGDDLIRGETSATSLTFRLHETGDMVTSGTVTALDFASRKTTATLPVQNAHRAHVSDWTDNARWAVIRDIPTTVTAPNVTNSHKAHVSDYATRAGTANAVPWVGISGVPTTMTAAQNAHKAHTLDWPTTATTNISGWAHSARWAKFADFATNAGTLGGHAVAWYEPALPATPADPTTKFLDGNRAWSVPSGGGGGGMVDPYTPPSGTFVISGNVEAGNINLYGSTLYGNVTGNVTGNASNASNADYAGFAYTASTAYNADYAASAALAYRANYVDYLGTTGNPSAYVDPGGNMYVPGTVDADDYYTHTEDAPFTPQVALDWVRRMRPTASGQLDHERIPPWARKVGVRTVRDVIPTTATLTRTVMRVTTETIVLAGGVVRTRVVNRPVAVSTTITSSTIRTRQVWQDSASLQKLTFLGLKGMQQLAQQNDDMATSITVLNARVTVQAAKIQAMETRLRALEVKVQ